MSIDLTDEQRQAVKHGEPVRVLAPELGGDVIVLSAERFENLQALLDDEKEKRAFRQAGLKSAIQWMKDNPY